MVATVRHPYSRGFVVKSALIPALGVVGLFACLAVPPAWLARRRGRNMLLWAGLGIVCLPMTILALIALDQSKEPTGP